MLAIRLDSCDDIVAWQEGEPVEADKPQTPEKTRTSFRFKLGVFFLIFNIPFGFGGAAAAGAATQWARPPDRRRTG